MTPAVAEPSSTATQVAEAPLVLAVEATRVANDVRGIGRYVRALLPRLLRQRPGLRIILFVKRRRDIERVQRRLAPLGLASDRVMVRHIREMKHCQADLFWYPWNIASAPPERGAVVVTIHDVAPLVLPDPRRRKWWKNFRWRRRYLATAKRATLIVTVSEFTASEVHRLLGVPRARLRVTHLAADDFDVPPAARDDDALARLGVRTPFVLAVGAAERRKNLAFLERAMHRVVGSIPDVTLVLAGPRRRDRRPSSAPPWQRTLGFVSEEDLASLYRAARALIAPSSYEGFGLPVLEAMRLGTPVICAGASSLPEVAGDAAQWVVPDDDAQLASTICRVVGDDGLRATMRAASIAQGLRFSWDETARLTLAAFDDALDAARRGA